MTEIFVFYLITLWRSGSLQTRKTRGRPKGTRKSKSVSKKPVKVKPKESNHKDFADSTSTVTTTTTPSISVSLSTISTVKSEVQSTSQNGVPSGRPKSHRKVQKQLKHQRVRKSKKTNSKLPANGSMRDTISNLTSSSSRNGSISNHSNGSLLNNNGSSGTNSTTSTLSGISQAHNQHTAQSVGHSTHSTQKRNARTLPLSQRQSNTIHSGQVSSDLVRYQRLQNQRFNQNHHGHGTHSNHNGHNTNHSNHSNHFNLSNGHQHNAATTAALNALNAAVNSHRTNMHLQSLQNHYLNNVVNAANVSNVTSVSPANLIRQQSTPNHQSTVNAQQLQNLQNVLSAASLTSPCYLQVQAAQPHYITSGIASYPTNHQRTRNGNAFTAVSNHSGPSPLNNRTANHYGVNGVNGSYSYQQQQQQYAHSTHSNMSNHSGHSQSISRRNGTGNMVSGHKRQRPADSATNSILPMSKRQKVNANGSAKSTSHNAHSQSSSTLQLVAIQPPQPENVKMPELQPSATPKAKETTTKRSKVVDKSNQNANGNSNDNTNGNGNSTSNSNKSPFPNPSVSTMSSPSDRADRQRDNEDDVKMEEDTLDKEQKKKQYPTADDVSSIASVASGVNSESPKAIETLAPNRNQTKNNPQSVSMNIGINVDLDDGDNVNSLSGAVATDDLVSTVVNRVNLRADSLSDTESEGDLDIQRTPHRDGNHNKRGRGRKKRNGRTLENGYNRSHFASPSHRQFLSEPPPPTSARYQISTHSSWYGFHSKQQRCLVPMRLPVEHITNKVTDKNLSPRERIEWLKSMIKYLTNCKNTMTQMCGQINSECQKVILCVEGIIQDLEQHQKC